MYCILFLLPQSSEDGSIIISRQIQHMYSDDIDGVICSFGGDTGGGSASSHSGPGDEMHSPNSRNFSNFSATVPSLTTVLYSSVSEKIICSPKNYTVKKIVWFRL